MGNFFVIDMSEKDVILGMDWLISHHALIDCEQGELIFKEGHKIKGQARNIKFLLGFATKLMRGVRQGCETFFIFANEI